MIVVISIMAVLTAIIYSSFDISKAQSRDRKRVSDISVIQIALEQYFQKYGVYPVSLDSILGNSSENSIKFLAEMPKDPTTNIEYTKNYFPMTKIEDSPYCISYHLWTLFEQKNSFLESKKSFDSTKLSKGVYKCGVGQNNGINANASGNELIYDVMP